MQELLKMGAHHLCLLHSWIKVYQMQWSTQSGTSSILLGAVRWTLKLTHQGLRANLTCIASSASIVRVVIKLILLIVSSKNIASIKSGMPRNTKSFMKIEASQSAQLWMGQVYNSEKPLLIFTEYSKERNPHWYYSRRFQHPFHSRTFMIFYLNHPKFF